MNEEKFKQKGSFGEMHASRFFFLHVSTHVVAHRFLCVTELRRAIRVDYLVNPHVARVGKCRRAITKKKKWNKNRQLRKNWKDPPT